MYIIVLTQQNQIAIYTNHRTYFSWYLQKVVLTGTQMLKVH